MPPFTSWMPPEAVAKAVDALHPTQAQQSAPQYTFPDALPKVGAALNALSPLLLPPLWDPCGRSVYVED